MDSRWFKGGATGVLERELRRWRQTWWPSAQLARRLDLVRRVAVLAVSDTHLAAFAMEPEFGSWHTQLGDEVTRYRLEEIMAVRERTSLWGRTPVDIRFADHSTYRIRAHQPDRLLEGFRRGGIPVS